MKKKIKIRTGLLVTLLIFIIVAMLALWLIQTVFMDRFYQSVRSRDISSLSNEISSLVTDDWKTQLDDGAFQDKMQQLSSNNEASVCFMVNGAPYGVSYMQNDVLFRLIRENVLDGYVSEAQKNLSTSMHSIMFEEGGTPYALVLVKALKSGTDNLTLVIVTDLIPTSSLTRTVTIQLATISTILVILAVLIAYLLSKKFAKPITQLSEVSKNLANSTDSSKFPKPTGIKELDELVQSLETASVELSRTDKLQKDLIANISHDLKTPLTLIGGYAEMMKDIPSENNAENLDVIIKETKHLSALVCDLSDLSKLQSGVIQFEDRTYDLTASVKDILDRYSNLLGETYTLSAWLPDHPIYVTADEVRIGQAISNLINNALKYTGSDKKIYVKLQDDGEKVTFMIKDTGKGIPPDKIGDVWQRYYKIDGSEKHDRFEVGSGLGLSIVKGVLQRYTADFGVKNVSDGCIFYFTLKSVNQ